MHENDQEILHHDGQSHAAILICIHYTRPTYLHDFVVRMRLITDQLTFIENKNMNKIRNFFVRFNALQQHGRSG